MEETIKKISRALQIQYYSFLLLSTAGFLVYEAGLLEEGIYAGDPGLQYIWSTASILITLLMVPFSLKLYSYVMTKQIDHAPLNQALKLYKKWNEIRLLMLALPTFFNIFVYYATLDNMGAFCALISITASIFCLPGEKKLKDELNINEKTKL